MNEKRYNEISDWIRKNKFRYTAFQTMYKVLPAFVIMAYALLLCFLLVEKDIRIWKVIMIPFVLFVVTSIIRKIIDRPRPYAVLNFNPLIQKEKQGESFPSRHVLSASLIAAACLFVHTGLGIFVSVLTLFICIIRVISGVHYISDVVAGAVIGYLCGLIMFFSF